MQHFLKIHILLCTYYFNIFITYYEADSIIILDFQIVFYNYKLYVCKKLLPNWL